MFYKLQELFWIVNDSERSWGIFRDSSWIPRRFCVNFKDPGGFFRDLFDPRRSLGDFFERFSRILPDWTRNPRNLLGFPTIFDDPVKIGSRIQGFLRSWTILLRNSQEFFRDPQIFSTIPDDPVGFFKHGSKLPPKPHLWLTRSCASLHMTWTSSAYNRSCAAIPYTVIKPWTLTHILQ